jgi:ABC-type lipoprotein release transport system permease subunit
MSFAIPWLHVAVILAVPLVAALFATVRPAAQAARIRPAVALRIAD